MAAGARPTRTPAGAPDDDGGAEETDEAAAASRAVADAERPGRPAPSGGMAMAVCEAVGAAAAGTSSGLPRSRTGPKCCRRPAWQWEGRGG